MNLTEQRELQRIVEALENRGYCINDEFAPEIHVDPDFQKLKAMAYEPRVNKTEPNAITALKWEDLLSMRDEAQNVKIKHFNTTEREKHAGFTNVSNTIKAEIERRLLNLLPKEGGNKHE